MSEPGDKLARRYRELAREEPPAALDARILAAARSGSDPKSKARGPAARWMGPVSIAAVLVLGIGVSLRMQLETPGIETSIPSSPPSEYSTPPAPEPPAPPAPAQAPARADSAMPAVKPQTAAGPEVPTRRFEAPPSPKALRKERAVEEPAHAEATRNAAQEPVPNPFTDAPVTMQAPVPVSPPMTSLGAAVPPPQEAGRMAPQSAPLRAKREGVAADAASGARESRAAAAVPDPDPQRELERIATLRASGQHAEADRALEALRRRHPDFRIPEAMWERVKPR